MSGEEQCDPIIEDLVSRLDSLGEVLKRATDEYAAVRLVVSQLMEGKFKTEAGRLTPEGVYRLRDMLAAGHKKRQIAEELGISRPAVSKHVARLSRVPRSLS